MRFLLSLLALFGLFSVVFGQPCTSASFEASVWASNFDLTPLQLPSVVIDTTLTFNDDGTWDATTTYSQCSVNASGEWTYTAPDLILTTKQVGMEEPLSTSVSCEILGIAHSAIGTGSFLPEESNVTWSAGCTSWNQTFVDSSATVVSRFWTNSALLSMPSLLVLLSCVMFVLQLL